MQRLPARSNLDHLKKQAKDLIRLYRNRDPEAMKRLRDALPAAARKNDDALAALDLRLHDAQSCVAREYGFASWADIARYVEAQSATSDRDARVLRWLELVYSGHVSGTLNRSHPRVAARMLAETTDLVAGDSYLACAVGDEGVLRTAIDSDPNWVNRPGGPLKLPPLIAVTHSSLLKLPEFRPRLLRSARLLLAAGADPNLRIGNRWPPASVSHPSETELLSALYGAAAETGEPELTRLLLDAGADPNDGESLYHSVENLAVTRLLLQHGARVEEAIALYRALDFDNLAVVELLLQYGADPNALAPNPPISDWGTPLLWAIRRRRSRRHIEALLQAGANAEAKTPAGVSAYRLALQFGLPDVAALLRDKAGAEPLTEEDAFIAACARGDAAEARRIRERRPDLPRSLSEAQLRLLPEMVEQGADDAAKLMVTLDWPIAVHGGDWNASALNLAVFWGKAELTRFLLQHGASWTEEHGHGDNACGTLSWASRNQPAQNGDWVGCAQALLEHGMPAARPDPDDPEWVLIDGRPKRFSDEVTEVLLNGR
jgi:ankyrin repeat protein